MVNARTFLWVLWGLGLPTGVSYGVGWWDFEYDGSVTPDLATPAWSVSYTEASTDGDVLSFGPRSAAVLDALARAVYAVRS